MQRKMSYHKYPSAVKRSSKSKSKWETLSTAMQEHGKLHHTEVVPFFPVELILLIQY